MPLYNINKTYLENLEEGPFFSEEIPKRALPPKNEWIEFLGVKLASPIGVPAGPLLDAKWVSLAGKLGFDQKVMDDLAYEAGSTMMSSAFFGQIIIPLSCFLRSHVTFCLVFRHIVASGVALFLRCHVLTLTMRL